MECNKCGKCCRLIEICNMGVLSPGDIQVLRWKGAEIIRNTIKLIAPCQHLDPETHLCNIYENRPDVCKEYYCERVSD